MVACLLGSMMLGAGAGGQGGQGQRGATQSRQPPAWSPDREAYCPFRHWVQDLLAWGILATDTDSSRQCAAIILQLSGAARELARSMNYWEMTAGGVINGQQHDAVSHLLHNLAAQFGPLGEESRLQATRELFEFTRRRGEVADALPSRFLALRFRAN